MSARLDSELEATSAPSGGSVIEDYANGEIQRNEAAKQIAKVVVATAEKQQASK